MEQVKWFNRVFQFDSTQHIFPSVIERLSGTPARLEEKFTFLSPDILTQRIGGSWTIQENLGHLIDLEPLWQGRLADILTGETELRPTDLQNTQTTLANHNQTPIATLLTRFRETRQQTVGLLSNLTEDDIFRSALHPRLKTPMRTTDLFLFVAEHDDHHLARITAMAKSLSLKNNP